MVLTDVAFVWAVPSARMVICTPHHWCHLSYNPNYYIRVTLCGDADTIYHLFWAV